MGTGASPNPAKFWSRLSWLGLQMAGSLLWLGRQFNAGIDRAVRTCDLHNLAGSSAAVVSIALPGVNRYNGNDSRAANTVKSRDSQPQPGLIERRASVSVGEGSHLNGAAARSGTKDTLVLAGVYYFCEDSELYLALHSNRSTDGYRLEALNQIARNCNTNAGSVACICAGIANGF